VKELAQMKAFILDRLERQLSFEGFAFSSRGVEARRLSADQIQTFDDTFCGSVRIHTHTPFCA
jgi:hypothetical protein